MPPFGRIAVVPRKEVFIFTRKNLWGKLWGKIKRLIDHHNQKPLAWVPELSLIILIGSIGIGTTQAFSQNPSLTGTGEKVTALLKNIDPYTLGITESSYNPNHQREFSYLARPALPATTTREELEQKEKSQKQLASARRTVARERTSVTQADPSRLGGLAETEEPAKIINRSNRPAPEPNHYAYGYCTWYVAQRRAVPNNWGNAKNWLASASRAGYETGTEPRPGAIIVTRESFWGHVGYVEEVQGEQITVSDMNLRGWGRITTRTLSKDDPVIRGYIY